MRETPRYLRVARVLAALPVGVVACASGTTETAPPLVPPAPSASPSPVASSDEGAHVVQGDPTEGTGPCRCSWETNASAAPRVCKKGETNHAGTVCVPNNRPKYPMPVVGPLSPPDLSSA